MAELSCSHAGLVVVSPKITVLMVANSAHEKLTQKRQKYGVQNRT